MTIQDMHYDFKKKLNKLDSQQNRNLLTPEIDWTLNEAYEIYVKLIAQPRQKTYLGFEINQRSIDDIRTIVVNNNCLNVVDNQVPLPTDYWHYVSGHALISKGDCKAVKAKFHPRQHDDTFEESSFYNSNFEWRSINGLFTKDGIKTFDDGTFTVDTLCIDYIQKLDYIHNAQSFRNGTYKLPSGVVLTGTVNCPLPSHTHREIVDIAVLLASGDIQSPGYELHMNKLKLNQILP